MQRVVSGGLMELSVTYCAGFKVGVPFHRFMKVTSSSSVLCHFLHSSECEMFLKFVYFNVCVCHCGSVCT